SVGGAREVRTCSRLERSTPTPALQGRSGPAGEARHLCPARKASKSNGSSTPRIRDESRLLRATDGLWRGGWSRLPSVRESVAPQCTWDRANGTLMTDSQVIGNRVSNIGDQSKAIRNGGTCNQDHGIYVSTNAAVVENNVILDAVAYGIHYYSA